MILKGMLSIMAAIHTAGSADTPMPSGPFIDRAIIVAGAQKSGTSSLCAALAQHPAISACIPKEPHFFAMSPETVRQHWKDYIGLFDQPDNILLDGSTSYLHSPRAIQQIKQAVADPIILIILRDPAKRAYSAYLHNYKAIPHADQRDFQALIAQIQGPRFETIAATENAALDDAIQRGLVEKRYAHEWAYHVLQGMPFTDWADDPFWDWRYVQNSCYSHWVAAYERAFGDRVLVLFFEDFVANTPRVMREVLSFLGLPVEEACLQSPGANPTMLPTTFGRAIYGVRRRIPISRSVILDPLSRHPMGRRLADAFRARVTMKPPRMDAVQYTKTRDILRDEYAYWKARHPHLEQNWRQRS